MNLDIICPTCRSKFSNTLFETFLECNCYPNYNSISKDLRYYRFHLKNIEIFSVLPPNMRPRIHMYIYSSESSNLYCINAFIPVILDGNIIQIDKMIDKFNKLYTLS